jgi:hypothetical protein
MRDPEEPGSARRAQGQAPDRRSREDTIYRIEAEASPPIRPSPSPEPDEPGAPRPVASVSVALLSLHTVKDHAGDARRAAAS